MVPHSNDSLLFASDYANAESSVRTSVREIVLADRNASSELASMLRISKEEAAEMKADFNFHISEITRFVPAKLSQELYDQMLGKDVVKSEEEFRKFIADDIKKNFNSEAEYQFTQDLRSYVINRIGEVEFPEALLKRFMKLRNADKGEEYVENNFKDSLPELLWLLAKEQICDQLEVKVQHEDVLETAKAYIRRRDAQERAAGTGPRGAHRREHDGCQGEGSCDAEGKGSHDGRIPQAHGKEVINQD